MIVPRSLEEGYLHATAAYYTASGVAVVASVVFLIRQIRKFRQDSRLRTGIPA